VGISKRASTLTDVERSKLFSMFDLYPEIGVAWLLKEEFASIYDAGDRDEADRRLQVWNHHVMASGIGEFLRTWFRTLGAPGRRRSSTTSTTGPRTRSPRGSPTRSRSSTVRYGFRNPVRYRSKVLLACGHRRKSEADHRSSR
jgi:hypothetical protein